MLSKSGIDLNKNTLEFVSTKENLVLFSAYLKFEALKELNYQNHIKQVVVRWEVQDLCMGASDLNVYQYCLENKIILYRNPRIHLKAIWDGNQSVFYGSANVTGRGLGEKGNYNYELNGDCQDMTLSDRLYLQDIINSSQIVAEDLYLQLKDTVDKFQSENKKIEYPEIKSQDIQRSKFLISQLPMTAHPEELFINYSESEIELSSFDSQCFINDVTSFSIPLGLTKEGFMDTLRTNFNAHPFIQKLKEFIVVGGSRNYGSIVRWIQDNTSTVPIPRSWELKKDQIVNILYDWICFFDSAYYWERPRHSQIIYFK